MIRIANTEGLSGTQVAALSLILGGLLGIAGLTSLCLMVWFSHQRFGVDRSAKHGISVKNTSRLGGVAVALFLFIVWIVTVVYPGVTQEGQQDLVWGPPFLILAVLLACIGFLDDLGLPLSPVVRLVASSVIFLIAFALVPDWMPNRLIANFSVTSPWFGAGLIIVSVFVCVGFINAGNMSDGANGLFSGICLTFFLCAWKLTGDSFYFSLGLGLLSFFLINVLTGRIIMGDFGAYGLSTMIALVGFDLFDRGLVGLSFLATLLSYPCLEIVRIFVVRITSGESPMRADNRHSHNLLNEHLAKMIKNKVLTNSLTGVSISLLSVAPAIVLLLLREPQNELLCAVVFGLQCAFFLLAHILPIAFKRDQSFASKR